MEENLFSPTVDTSKFATEQNGNANEFHPRYSKNPQGVYEAFVRFVPWPKNPNNSIVGKVTSYVENVVTGKKKQIDCVADQWSCPIASTYHALRKDPNPILQERKKHFSRKQRYSSLVYVIKNPTEPNTEGKILVWSYGQKVFNKIDAIQHPSGGGGSLLAGAVEPHNPFDMVNGKAFYVKVVAQETYDNFDNCQFVDKSERDERYAIRIPITNGDQTQYYPITAQNLANDAFKQQVIAYLNSDAVPSLEPYEYHEWDDETRKFVNDAINAAKDPNSRMSQSVQNTPTAAGLFQQNAGAPQAAQPAAGIPGFGQPVAPAAAPGLGVPQASPVTPLNPAPQAAPVNVAAPFGGLDVGGAAPTAPSAGPGTFSDSNVNSISGLSDVLGGIAGGQPAAPATPAAQPAAPAVEPAPGTPDVGGLALNDVLGTIL